MTGWRETKRGHGGASYGEKSESARDVGVVRYVIVALISADVMNIRAAIPDVELYGAAISSLLFFLSVDCLSAIRTK